MADWSNPNPQAGGDYAGQVVVKHESNMTDLYTGATAKLNLLKSTHSGTSAPSNPSTGQMWVDTTASPHLLKRYNGTGWVVVLSMVFLSTATTPTNMTHQHTGILAVTTAWDVELVLPSAADTEAHLIVLKKVNSANSMKIKTQTGEKIDGTVRDTTTLDYTNDDTCVGLMPDGTDWHTVFLYGVSGPSFSVHRNGVIQNNITGTEKIRFTTEAEDTNDDFAIDADDSGGVTESRYLPTEKGNYILSASAKWSNLVSGDYVYIYIYKNGGIHRQFEFVANATSGSTLITVPVSANGTSDYFEVFVRNASRDTSDLSGVSYYTYFTGCKVS